MSKKNRANIYTHCAACDTALNDAQPVDKNTGEVSDLCGICRKSIRKAVYFHEEDVQALEMDVWRIKMGSEDLFFNPDSAPRTAEAQYQGCSVD